VASSINKIIYQQLLGSEIQVRRKLVRITWIYDR